MNELVYASPGQLEWAEAPDPRINHPGQALVRPIASAFCDLDRRILSGLTPFKPRFAIGHEAVAEVVEVGSEVQKFRVGDVVSVPWKISCGQCSACRSGRTMACSAVPKLACYGATIGGAYGGLFSDLVNVPFADAMLVHVPAGVSPASVAAASDNLTDAWVSVSKPLMTRSDARVLVVGGTESLGLLATQMAVAAGAAEVAYLDADPERRAKAAMAGASVHEGKPEDLHEQFDVSISATREESMMRTALLGLTNGGHCSCIGIMFEDPRLPLFQMYMRDVTMSVGFCSVRPYMPTVLELVRDKRCDPLSVTTIVQTEEAPAALALNSGKVVVVRPRLFQQ